VEANYINKELNVIYKLKDNLKKLVEYAKNVIIILVLNVFDQIF
jgi:hypothetical protein